MLILENPASILLLVFALNSTAVNAEAQPAAQSAVVSPNQTVMHIEKAKVEISHADFVPPSSHIKAARAESEKVTGNPDLVKKANSLIIKAQIKVNAGDIKGATDDLNQALAVYSLIKAD